MEKYPISTKMISSTSVARMSLAKLEDYMAEQRELRNAINERAVSAGRAPIFTADIDDFSSFHIVPDGERFRIIKREKRLELGLKEDGTVGSVSTPMVAMLNQKCGKYNDGALLHLADSASIELGEVQANGGGFFS